LSRFPFILALHRWNKMKTICNRCSQNTWLLLLVFLLELRYKKHPKLLQWEGHYITRIGSRTYDLIYSSIYWGASKFCNRSYNFSSIRQNTSLTCFNWILHMSIMTNSDLNQITCSFITQYHTARKTSLNFGDPFFNLYTAFLFSSAMLCLRGVNTSAAIIYQQMSL
jgi:hypothetical protein